MNTVKLNTLPAPTFSWLGVNDTQRELGGYKAETKALPGPRTSIDVSADCAYEITAQDGEKKFAAMFIGGENSLQIKTNVDVGSSSQVTLVQVFESKAQTVSELTATAAENARFELVQLYLHTPDTVSQADVTLDGRKAEFTANIGYLLGDSDDLDINLTAKHLGRKTVSGITAKGVMNGSARKTFKGTIDFLRGCAGAVGMESEDVLLIGEKAVNKTVPLILCAEEDVEGSHGASIGRVDEQHIFYMMSRGLPEERIIQLTAQSKISQTVNSIGDEETAERIKQILGQGDEDE